MNKIPIQNYTTQFWDIKTERAKHHDFKPSTDPLYFCLKKKGGVSSRKRDPPKRFSKYKMPNHKGMLTRLKIVGPKWD